MQIDDAPCCVTPPGFDWTKPCDSLGSCPRLLPVAAPRLRIVQLQNWRVGLVNKPNLVSSKRKSVSTRDRHCVTAPEFAAKFAITGLPVLRDVPRAGSDNIR